MIRTTAEGHPFSVGTGEPQELDVAAYSGTRTLIDSAYEPLHDAVPEIHPSPSEAPIEASMPHFSADKGRVPAFAATFALAAGAVAVVAIYVGFPLVLAMHPQLGTLSGAVVVALLVLALGLRSGLALLRSTARLRARGALRVKRERATAIRRAPDRPSFHLTAHNQPAVP